MLFHIKDHVLISLNGEQQIIEITDFFSVSSNSLYYTFVKGNLFVTVHEKGIHTYSGSYFVTSASQETLANASKLIRKVMLYPDPNNIDSPAVYVVIDFNRPSLPMKSVDVLVPIYPKVNDMPEIA